jgi:hypothetical protein
MGGKDREDRPLFDWERTTRFFCYGLAMSAWYKLDNFLFLSNVSYLSTLSGPIMGRWNIFLERRFPSCSAQMGKLSIKSLSKRVAADQLIMYAAVLLSCIFHVFICLFFFRAPLGVCFCISIALGGNLTTNSRSSAYS